MNQSIKRGLALFMAFIMCIAILPILQLNADAAANNNITYKENGNYIYNWGEREEVATFLSPMAESFYKNYNTSYDKLSAYKGGTSQSNVPSSALYDALQALMKKAHSHETNYGETRYLYQYTDCENNGSVISSFYSGISIGPNWDSGQTWNREHTWPNSKGLEGNDENDIMMLRPTSVKENGSRSNKAYGKSTGYYYPNTESKDTHDVRGDVARIFLYIYVRWENTGKAWGTSGVMESSEVLLEWMEEDPVDTWELGRNDSVQAITGTRNVFIDYPELAFILFGEDIPSDMETPSGIAKNQSSSGTDKPDTPPVQEDCTHIYDYPCDNTCNKCNAERDVTHIYIGWEVVKEATDDAPGLEKGTCVYCKTEGEREIPKLNECGHIYDYPCDSTCNKCNAERDVTHIYIGWEVIEEATADAPGLERGTCIYCKTEGDREIPHLNAPDNEEPNNPPMEDDEENNNPSLDDNDGEQDSDTTDEQVGFFGKIANFFKNLFQKIASLFKRKK